MLAPDLRGFGSTEAPGRGYDGETFARDQIALLDALGIEQVKLIGHDWGGWTAMMLGLDHPERIDCMIVIDAPHPWPRLRPSLIPELWRSWYAAALATPVLGPWLLRRTGFAKGILRRGTAPGTFTPAELDEYADGFREPARDGDQRALPLLPLRLPQGLAWRLAGQAPRGPHPAAVRCPRSLRHAKGARGMGALRGRDARGDGGRRRALPGRRAIRAGLPPGARILQRLALRARLRLSARAVLRARAAARLRAGA